MQLWMEINVVTLHKVVETMPQQMRSVIKVKCVTFFFWLGSVFSYMENNTVLSAISFPYQNSWTNHLKANSFIYFPIFSSSSSLKMFFYYSGEKNPLVLPATA